MIDKNLEYFIELLGQGKEITGSFNLWAKQEDRYYNLATFFYNDPLCGCQWSVNEINRAVNYNKQEIEDELENSLRPIPSEVGERLITLEKTQFQEVVDYLIRTCEEKGDIVGIKFYRKLGEKNE